MNGSNLTSILCVVVNNNHPSTRNDNIIVGSWLRISQKLGSDMCYCVSMVSGFFLNLDYGTASDSYQLD